mmetsp:Transcript_31182/g.50706  ORF Transcript_31182/g.50706 Transcript_31182/m.50706 type:complete len:369 (-) Transcript_31182:191-1297(-)
MKKDPLTKLMKLATSSLTSSSRRRARRKVKSSGTPTKESHTSFDGYSLLGWEVKKNIDVIDYADFRRMKYLGSGNFANVYTAKLHGNKVAVKIAKSAAAENVSQIRSEIDLLAKISHPNCIKIIGAGLTPDDDPRPFIVLEYLANGDMCGYLCKAAKRQSNYSNFMGLSKKKKKKSVAKDPHFWQRLDFCVQLARALAYLHHTCLAAEGRAILHRDLKPSNLLLTNDGRLVLADFGLATTQPVGPPSGGTTEPFEMTGETGSPRYMAPENALGLPYGPGVDTYAFALVAWQVLTVQLPFGHLGGDRAAFNARVVRGGERPGCPAGWPPALAGLLEACWAAAPPSRPDMVEVLSVLEAVGAEGKGGGGA